MKLTLLFFFWIVLIFFGELSTESNFKKTITICHGACTGSAYCSACKNCKYCKHCNSGGTCGVCSSGIKNRRSNEFSNDFSSKEEFRVKKIVPNNSSNINTTIIGKYFVVIKDKAYLYQSPSEFKPKRAFLVYGDKSLILAVSETFIYTEFRNPTGIITTGWVKKEDIAIR
ncbi:hypothetical protein [Emticicia agri]|uniref:SH3 domain-containing protein n=1 Tax=Emticicia agri TaxID=2492393 RepID=A0A4Q5LUA0_9BACT|nr:hypothetical protein [Emticicia agri]RYU93013.1 hypothetical protein EWM59_24170 [Emticicia agri]